MVRHFRRKARARATLAVKTKQEHPQAKREVLSSAAANRTGLPAGRTGWGVGRVFLPVFFFSEGRPSR